jgi:hypothetical protein
MLRSRFHRAPGINLAALAAPLLWMSAAAASPETEAAPDAASPEPAPSDVAEAPEATPDPSPEPAADADTPDAPADVASPEAPAARSTAAPAPAPAADIATSPESPAPPAMTAHAPVPAPEPEPVSASPQVVATARATAPGTPWIGTMADLGLPDGATMSLVVRPIRSIRAHAGLSHNLISLGERVGVTWVPLSWWVSPTLSLEYGHYTDGNANPLVRAVSGDTTFSSAILDRVGYNYANAHVGIELGRRWFTFYIHAGMSRITSTIHNLSAETMSESAGTTSVTFSKDPSVRLLTVSARVGFVVYLAK